LLQMSGVSIMKHTIKSNHFISYNRTQKLITYTTNSCHLQTDHVVYCDISKHNSAYCDLTTKICASIQRMFCVTINTLSRKNLKIRDWRGDGATRNKKILVTGQQNFHAFKNCKASCSNLETKRMPNTKSNIWYKIA